MEIRELKYLYEISQCQSLEQAAAHLFITQPSLTKAVKKWKTILDLNFLKKQGVEID